MHSERILTLALLLGLFALPVVPTTGPMVCPVPEAPRAVGCCGMPKECCRAPVSFALGLAFDQAQRFSPSMTPAARAAATARPMNESTPALWVRQVPPRPFSLLSVWRI